MAPRRALDEDSYARLRRLAARIRVEKGGLNASIQPTELLHEAWLKLDRADVLYESREHFLALAARAMRQIAIDRARARGAAKRGGGLRRTTLAGLPGDFDEPMDVLVLDRALRELEAVRPQAAQVAMLRAFGGMTVSEAAEALELSSSSVDRAWRFAKAFLAVHLAPAATGD